MLIEGLYSEISKVTEENSVQVKIQVDNKHQIFQGHFPNNPVMPGVCLLQIMKELTESFFSENLFMEMCSNVKFMAKINPDLNPILDIDLAFSKDQDQIKAKGAFSFEGTPATKISAKYKIV